MGAAMSITAFPMLARIIYERGLAGTSLGTLALAAGALDDAVAWCVLAVVLASFTGNLWIAVFAIGGGVLYALLTLTLGRGWLERLLVPREADDKRRGTVIPLTLILVAACAWLTDSIGIYAVFGAFILGVAMPRGAVARAYRGGDDAADHRAAGADVLHLLRAQHPHRPARQPRPLGGRDPCAPGRLPGQGDRVLASPPASTASRPASRSPSAR